MGFVRAARPDDSEPISSIQLAAWRERYTGWPDTVWADLSSPITEAAWRHAITEPPTRDHLILVATETTGEVRGFASITPASGEDPVGDDSLIEMFEIDPDHRRSGHGSRLMAACAAQAPGTGLTVWIDQGSDAARFLIATGWGPRGRRRLLDIGDGHTLAQHEWWTTLEGP